MHGLLCDARKLTHVAYLRRDQLVPELLGIRRVASQSGALPGSLRASLRRGLTCRCFRSLWHWGLNRLLGTKEGLHPGLGFDAALTRGRTSGRCEGGVHPARSQALSASASGGVG